MLVSGISLLTLVDRAYFCFVRISLPNSPEHPGTVAVVQTSGFVLFPLLSHTCCRIYFLVSSLMSTLQNKTIERVGLFSYFIGYNFGATDFILFLYIRIVLLIRLLVVYPYVC